MKHLLKFLIFILFLSCTQSEKKPETKMNEKIEKDNTMLIENIQFKDGKFITIEFPSNIDKTKMEYYKKPLEIIIKKDLQKLFEAISIDSAYYESDRLYNSIYKETYEKEKKTFLEKQSTLYKYFYDTEGLKKIEEIYNESYSIYESLEKLGNNKIRFDFLKNGVSFKWTVDETLYTIVLICKKKCEIYRIKINWDDKRLEENRKKLKPHEIKILNAIREDKPEELIKYFGKTIGINLDYIKFYQNSEERKEFLAKKGILYDQIFRKKPEEWPLSVRTCLQLASKLETEKYSIRHVHGYDQNKIRITCKKEECWIIYTNNKQSDVGNFGPSSPEFKINSIDCHDK